MFTLEQWLVILGPTLLGVLITVALQGWLDTKKDQRSLVIQSTGILIFILVVWIAYRSIVDEYGPLEWNRLKMVGIQFFQAVAVLVGLLNFATYLVVSIAALVGVVELKWKKKVRTWVVIFICILIYAWAHSTKGGLIAERSHIMDNVTEDLIADTLLSTGTDI